VSYSINVSSVPDVIAGIKFARRKNVRLVVKNTGHEYVGSILCHVNTNLRYLAVSSAGLPQEEHWLSGPAI
jgi:hypothetical protein